VVVAVDDQVHVVLIDERGEVLARVARGTPRGTFLSHPTWAPPVYPKFAGISYDTSLARLSTATLPQVDMQ
jgi:hypothetical protein